MDGTVQSKIRQLGDVELAILLCIVAEQHCIFSTDYGFERALQEELRLACTSKFGLQPAIIECSPETTVDRFSEDVLISDETSLDRAQDYDRPVLSVNFNTHTRGRSSEHFGSNTLDDRRIADIIIVANLDQAPQTVQVQAVELIRTKRIFTRSAMHTASKSFVLLAIASKPSGRMSHHLNDLFCMSHFHPKEDELPYFDRKFSKEAVSSFSRDDINELKRLTGKMRLPPEMASYLHNIVIFMRNNRFTNGGVTATGTRQLRTLAMTLAPLHGLDYVTPSLITLAVRKVYPHRLKLATPETEASLQWGSDPEAIRQLLEGVTAEDAIEDVLASVETPL